MELYFAQQKEGHTGFISVLLCFLSRSPYFLHQTGFLLLVILHLFLPLLLLPMQARAVGAF